MKYLALACDYDETLTTDGRVAAATLQSLQRLRHTGRRLVIVTGRELEELLAIFPEVALFDRIVAENGGVLYHPATGRIRALGDPPSPDLVGELRNLGVAQLSIGQVIVAARRRNEETILATLARLHVDLQVVLNRDSLMLLPPGIDKASGLRAALHELDVTPDRCIGIGDAENDEVFLSICGLSVAVANAVPALKEQADVVTKQPRGCGVAELIGLLIASDEFQRAVRSSSRAKHRPV
jgi:hydroxymethylpyrimidine pyrophosphatase-like HAD family hydrolase